MLPPLLILCHTNPDMKRVSPCQKSETQTRLRARNPLHPAPAAMRRTDSHDCPTAFKSQTPELPPADAGAWHPLKTQHSKLKTPSTHPTKLGKICRFFLHRQLLPTVPFEIPFCRSHSGQAVCASSLQTPRPSVRALHRPVDWFFAKKHANHPNKPTKPGRNGGSLSESPLCPGKCICHREPRVVILRDGAECSTSP